LTYHDFHKPVLDLTNVLDPPPTNMVSRSLPSNAIRKIELGNYSAAYENFKNCSDPGSNNIKAVLLLRMQQPDAAVNLLRQQVWDIASLTLRNDVPAYVQLNLATAMFMSGNVNGCMEILRNTGVTEDEQAVELFASIKSWEKSLSLLKWLDWKICGIEHVKGCIPFKGTPGRFGWES
jgi:hypothetical protein